MGSSFSSARIGSCIRECPGPPTDPPTHWIEIILLGEDDRPIPFEEYLVILPSGTVVRGYLDGNGEAKIQGMRNLGIWGLTLRLTQVSSEVCLAAFAQIKTGSLNAAQQHIYEKAMASELPESIKDIFRVLKRN
jgi:hypothetical protein